MLRINKTCLLLLSCFLLVGFEFAPYIFITTMFYRGESSLDNLFSEYYSFISQFKTCDEKWITANMSGLSHDLNTYIYGQPFLLPLVVPALNHHLSLNHQPKKPLVFSFHGMSGTGKNYVTDFIIKNTYQRGVDTKFIKFYHGSIDFSSTADLAISKSRLQQDVQRKINQCPQSLFIFDEIDKVPEGIFDALKPYLEYSKHIENQQFRRSIFIFLSNIGSKKIYETCVNLSRNKTATRQFMVTDFEEALRNASFFENGALKHSGIIQHHLIDYYIPFLPLEKKHVQKCIEDEALRQGITPTPELIREVLSYVDFEPEPENAFSVSGCKNLASKIGFAAFKGARKVKDLPKIEN